MNHSNTSPSLLEISADNWSGKSVSQVLEAVGKDYQKHLFIDQKPGSLSAIGFYFEGEGWLNIYVSEFKYMERFNIDRKWDLQTFFKEEVSRVELEKD